METNEKYSSEFERFMEKYLEKQKEIYRFHINIFGTIVTLVIAALGLIAALAWDEALKSIFDAYFGGEGIGSKLAYAIVVTVIAAIISILLGKSFNKHQK